jgi:hypothetical protein
VLDDYKLKLSIRFSDPERSSSVLAGTFKTYLLSYTQGMLPHPEKIHERDLPGPLELSFDGGTLRFGLWPERELQERLQRARAAAAATTRK